MLQYPAVAAIISMTLSARTESPKARSGGIGSAKPSLHNNLAFEKLPNGDPHSPTDK
jgi:hypothetical protein